MPEYSEEDMERMVEESKAIHKIVEFANTEGVIDQVGIVAEAVLAIATNFQNGTDLTPEEIVSTIMGSLSGVLARWAIENG